MSKNQEYAERYANFAMAQMRKYGIPASVTLAQGILESSNGQSRLARKENNHFGKPKNLIDNQKTGLLHISVVKCFTCKFSKQYIPVNGRNKLHGCTKGGEKTCDLQKELEQLFALLS